MINLHTFLARMPLAVHRYTPREMRAIERTRAACINALVVDETRAWMNLGERQSEVLHGLAAMLLFAYHAQQHDNGAGAPAGRIIRGAMSAAATCAEAGAVITPQDATALSIAAGKARAALASASRDAIVHAARKASA